MCPQCSKDFTSLPAQSCMRLILKRESDLLLVSGRARKENRGGLCGTPTYIVFVSAQLCPTLCDPMDCSPPGSSVHGISQAGKLAWVSIAIPSSWGSSGPRDWIHPRLCVSSMGRRILYHCATREARQPFVLLDIFALHLLHLLTGDFCVHFFFLFCSLIIHFFGCHFLNWSVIDISI